MSRKFNPSLYSSPYISRVGCAGTKSKVAAANGKFVPYGDMNGGGCGCNGILFGGTRKTRRQRGGSSVYCMDSPDTNMLIGPRSGYAPVKGCDIHTVQRPLAIKGGKRRTGKRRGGKRRGSKRRGGKRTRSVKN